MRIVDFLLKPVYALIQGIQRENDLQKAQERTEFENQLQNQLELVPQRDKVQEIFNNNGLTALTVMPISLRGHLYIKGEVPVTDYKKYKTVLTEALGVIGHELSPCINPESLSSGMVRISQFTRAVGT